MIDKTANLRDESAETRHLLNHTAESDPRERDIQSEFHDLEKQDDAQAGGSRFLIWTGINIASTVAIVFLNKSIFSNPSFGNCQVTFAAYHFLITAGTLWAASRSSCGLFVPKEASLPQMLPLSAAMCIQVVLQNLGLAHSSVMFHQLSRLLLTPVVAGLNYILYGSKIPRSAFLPLALLCTGVGVVSYYDSLPKDDGKATTSFWGVLFAFAGVGASSIYVVWIGHYHRKLEMSSMQLLLNQAPVSAGLLLFAIPWMESPPSVYSVPGSMWFSILLSGILASIVNLSGFFIIDTAGAVSSTVVAQLKSCVIVGLGWASSGHVVMGESIFGIFMALLGMSSYMHIVLKDHM